MSAKKLLTNDAKNHTVSLEPLINELQFEKVLLKKSDMNISFEC